MSEAVSRSKRASPFKAGWVVLALVVAMTAGCVGLYPATPAVTSGIAIVNATVIDGSGEPPRAGMTVVVQGGTITHVEPTNSIELGPGIQRADGSGKYLIPGLWDMHTHVAEYASTWLPVMLANGITGVRNMHAVSVDLTNSVKRDLSNGALVGPRMVANGPLMDGPTSPWPTAAKVDSAEAAKAKVDELVDGGADFVKVYSFLSRDAYFAIADQARHRRVPFAGHVAQSISAMEATQAGQHSIEHLDGILLATASNEEELRRSFLEASAKWRNPATAQQGQAAMVAVNRALAASYDPAKATILFGRFVANETYQTPTLVTHFTNLHRAKPEILQNVALRYVPASIRAQWLSLPPPNADMHSSQLELFARYNALVSAMQQSGVTILAGTDTGGTLIVPGDSLHRELALLVEAGLTPMQAIQTATLNPARYFGEERVSGTIAVGKRADLLLLDRNPLEDIRNTRSIRTVIAGGKLYLRADLDRLLATAERTSSKQ